jgi:hypothetical protein
MVTTLDGLTGAAAYQKQLAAITGSAEYKQALALQAQLQQQEPEMQQELSKQFPLQNEAWWTGKIAELNKHIQTAKPQPVAHMYRRVLAYLGFICYMYSSNALKAGDMEHAESYLRIFKLADPQNPDCPYLQAMYHMKKENQEAAITSLLEAASLGYSDLSQLRSEQDLLPLHKNPEFIKAENKVIRNY